MTYIEILILKLIMHDQKLEKFIRTNIPTISKLLIYDLEENEYMLFESYSVKKIEQEISVTRLGDEFTFNFSKMKNAIAWVILDFNKKFYEANRIIELDFKLNSIIIEKKIYINIKKKTKDSGRYLLMLDKIDHNIRSEIKFRDELNKYIRMANSCQQQGFENELKRSSRK